MGCVVDGKRRPAVSIMLANFTRSTPSKPSLLKHDEVVTLFHELGHVLHGIVTQGVYSRFCGTHVERDFVEAPSQFLENFVYEAGPLRRISKHYETGEPLPENLAKALKDAKNCTVGLLTRRQLFFVSGQRVS